MPIKSIDASLTVPLAGKIRLGLMTETASGKEYPSNIPYFNLADAPDVAKVYGEKPTELHIQFFSSDLEFVAPYYYRWFSGGYKNKNGERVGGELRCKGDGEMADHYAARDIQTRVVPKRQCLGPDCPDWCDAKGNQQCKPGLNLHFTLPLVNPYQIYRMDTTSANNIRTIISALKPLAMQDPLYFRRMVWKISKYLEEGMKFYDEKSQTEKKTNQYLLDIQPDLTFREQYAQQLAALYGNIEKLLGPKTNGELRLNMTAEQVHALPMEDNYATKVVEPVGPTPKDIAAEWAESAELQPYFAKLCELLQAQNTPKTRILTARKFEKSANGFNDLAKYLQDKIAASTPKPAEQAQTVETKVTETQKQEAIPAEAKVVESVKTEFNTDGLI